MPNKCLMPSIELLQNQTNREKSHLYPLISILVHAIYALSDKISLILESTDNTHYNNNLNIHRHMYKKIIHESILHPCKQ